MASTPSSNVDPPAQKDESVCYKVGDFIVVKYIAGTRRRTVYFAGVISNHISSDEFEVQFLKSNKCSFLLSVTMTLILSTSVILSINCRILPLTIEDNI